MTIERKMGWKKDKRDERDYLFKPKLKLAIPDTFSLEPFLPTVRDQGNLGSCTGFGIGGKFTGLARKLKVFTEWFSPTWIYNGGRKIAGDLPFDTGCYPRDNYEFIRGYGLLLEHLRPYKDTLDKTDPTTWGLNDEAAKYPIISYTRITDGVENICAAIAEGNFVSIGSPWYAAWMDTDSQGRLAEDYSNVVGGHETFLYGYDKISKVFLGQNSWGSGWGSKGRFQMPFSAIAAFLKDDGYDAHFATVLWVPGPVPPEPPQPHPAISSVVWWVVGILAVLVLAAVLIL